MVDGAAGFSRTILVLLLIGVATISFGVFLTFWPRTMQRFAQRGFASKRARLKIKLLEDLLNTEHYVLSIRFIGVLALGIGATALTLLVRELGT